MMKCFTSWPNIITAQQMTKTLIPSNVAPPILYGSPMIISKHTNVSNCIHNWCATTPAGQTFRITGTITTAHKTLPRHMRHHYSISSLTQRPHSHLERHKCPSALLQHLFNSVLLKGTLQLLEQFRTGTQDPFQLMLTYIYFTFNGTFYDMKEHHCLSWL